MTGVLFFVLPSVDKQHLATYPLQSNDAVGVRSIACNRCTNGGVTAVMYAGTRARRPCGGRPRAVNGSNVAQLFDENGKPKFKYIVEGANLFITEDARDVLENAGVILYKDASTNKGGVTSSSFEVTLVRVQAPGSCLGARLFV